MAYAPGDMLTEGLRLERQIGSGAYGHVWTAEHVRLGSRVAVKILDAKLVNNEQTTARFLNEARTAAQIGSPHIVAIHDCNVTREGRPFIVMELLQGENLEQRVERVGPLPLGEMAEVVAQMCRALALAHARGIIHRDIKPSNVFLSATHRGLHIKLLDFGIARDPQLRLTGTSALLGTPLYMSKEQLADAKTIDHRADLWSTGVVAYQCLVGKLPFEAASLVALHQAIVRGEFTPPSAARGDLPPAVDAWFARVFARDIGAQFQSAAELAEAFQALVPDGASPQSVSQLSRKDMEIGPTAAMRAVSEGPSSAILAQRAAAMAQPAPSGTIVMGEPGGVKHTPAAPAGSNVDPFHTTMDESSLVDVAPVVAPSTRPPAPSNPPPISHAPPSLNAQAPVTTVVGGPSPASLRKQISESLVPPPPPTQREVGKKGRGGLIAVFVVVAIAAAAAVWALVLR